MTQPLIIANCSGFYGDRLSAAAEMVRGGPIDVLTGDYLAELTLAILYRSRQKNPKAGYAATFLKQMEQIMGECLERKIRVVTNAGGLNPRGMAEELELIAQKLGLKPKIAFIEGDDLMPRLADLQAQGEQFISMDKKIPLAQSRAVTLTANAYLGGWGIAAALAEGADIVVTPRITDAALVVGPAAWRFGWKRDDWHRLAGAVAAGHIIECGPQACGGNYSFYHEVPSFRNLGFPIAEMHDDGSFVITKHPGTGGIVNVGTVTAQLLYEIRGVRYPNPDVTARFDTAVVEQEAPDRVRVHAVQGEPPPVTTKVSINQAGGFRNDMTIMVSGLDIPEKAQIIEDQLFESLGGKEQFRQVYTHLTRTDRPDPQSNEQAVATLRVMVVDDDPLKVGKKFSSKVVELALSTVPGFKMAAPPGEAAPFVTFWPGVVSNKHITQHVFVDGKDISVASTEGAVADSLPPSTTVNAEKASGKSVRVPLGNLFGARSGDKGGSANLGIWAKTPAAYDYLRAALTVDRLKRLMPDLAEFPIERHLFPNLLALNFYIEGILGDGAIASPRFDPQAKTLAEYLRAKMIEVPESLLG